MKKYIIILILMLVNYSIYAQGPGLEWQKCFGGSYNEFAEDIKSTADGGYILIGETYSLNGDVVGNHGNNDAWVVKISSAGSLEWQKCLGGTQNDYAFSIQCTVDGGYVIAGETWSTDGDVLGNHGNNDSWVVKISSSGSLEWQRCLGGSSEDSAQSIQITADGGYIIAGYTYSNNGDVFGNHGYDDAWIVKLSSSGSLEWQICLGGSSDDRANSIQSTADGGYIMGGWTFSTDGDVFGNHGSKDFWVVKISNIGVIEWKKCIGGPGIDVAYSIQTTFDGGYVVAGYSASNGGDVSGNIGNNNGWVVKLNNTGSLEWQKSLGGSASYAKSIQSTADGGYILGGYSSDNNIISMSGYVNGHQNDFWTAKINNIGNIEWQKCFGGTEYDQASSVQPTPDGGYIMSGWTNSNNESVSGNHGGPVDIWVIKLAPYTFSTTAFEKDNLEIYPNPSSSIVTIKNPKNIHFDKITITDLTGKVVFLQTTNTNQINVESLTYGIYIINVFSESDIFKCKFLKE